MGCDRDICVINEYNGIGCDECGYNVLCDTAVQREQDAYDSGYIAALKEVLTMIEEVAYEEDELAEWTKAKLWHTVMRERTQALGEENNTE